MNSIATHSAAPKLSPSRYIGYGLGDLAFNFYWLPLNYFLTKYYTDVLGISPATAGIITAVCLWWDAFIDPAIGILANRTRSRFGRYRPYMLYGCVPLAVSFTLIFFPVPFKDTSLIIYAFATQLLFRTAYAAVNIPYGAMMASMTRDSLERNWLSSVRMFCAFGGSAVVGYFTPRLVEYFQVAHGNSAHFISTAILSSIAIGIILMCFLFTEERIQTAEETHTPLLPMLKMIATNVPFLQAMGGIALFSVANVLVSNTLAYFVQYNLGLSQTISGNIILIITLTQMVFVLPWSAVSRRIGKRGAWIVGLTIAAAPLFAIYAIDHPSIQTVYVLFGVYAAGCASIAVNFWSMIPDTVEYGEWRTGVRAEGFIFGFVTLVQKGALGLGTLFVGGYLTWIGYVANQVQTQQTLDGIKAMMTVIAVIGLAASCVVIYFYRLSAESHSKLVGEIAVRMPVSAS
jgi:GPH family glycoside/pentoside/hexuronide:cation symporter